MFGRWSAPGCSAAYFISARSWRSAVAYRWDASLDETVRCLVHTGRGCAILDADPGRGAWRALAEPRTVAHDLALHRRGRWPRGGDAGRCAGRHPGARLQPAASWRRPIRQQATPYALGLGAQE